MSEELARRFMDGLRRLEDSKDTQTITYLFADDCEIGNVIAHARFRGQSGAAEFWRKYRDAFKQVKSSFKNIITSGNRAALEWTTDGTGPDGAPFSYSGVTILEMSAGKINRCWAYFDAEHLGRQLAATRRKEIAAHI